MPAECRPRAFEPFFTTKDVGKGTGLGLDISRRIVVDRHHGEITIDSDPGAPCCAYACRAARGEVTPRDQGRCCLTTRLA